MKERFFIGLVFLLIVIVVIYLIVPAFVHTELDEPDPLAHMDDEKREEFEKQMKDFEGDVIEMNDLVNIDIGVISFGEFKPKFHDVAGTVKVFDTPEGRVLRFEDFETINGPRLKIYLSSDLVADDFVDLGEIKATKGNINYHLSRSVDLEKYDKVLVWCEPFGVLFSYAELN